MAEINQVPVEARVFDAIKKSALPLSRRDLESKVAASCSEFSVRDAIRRLVGKKKIRRVDEGDGVPRYTVAGDIGIPPTEMVRPDSVCPDEIMIVEAAEESIGDPIDENEGDEPVYCAIDQALASLSEKLHKQPKPIENADLKIRVLEALRDLLDPEIGKVLESVAEDLMREA